MAVQNLGVWRMLRVCREPFAAPPLTRQGCLESASAGEATRERTNPARAQAQYPPRHVPPAGLGGSTSQPSITCTTRSCSQKAVCALPFHVNVISS